MNSKTIILYSYLVETAPKIALLNEILTPLLDDGLIIAFSGGVDSSFLLWAAIESLKLSNADEKKGRVLAMLAVSPSIPAWEIQDAKAFSETFIKTFQSHIKMRLLLKPLYPWQKTWVLKYWPKVWIPKIKLIF